MKIYVNEVVVTLYQAGWGDNLSSAFCIVWQEIENPFSGGTTWVGHSLGKDDTGQLNLPPVGAYIEVGTASKVCRGFVQTRYFDPNGGCVEIFLENPFARSAHPTVPPHVREVPIVEGAFNSIVEGGGVAVEFYQAEDWTGEGGPIFSLDDNDLLGSELWSQPVIASSLAEGEDGPELLTLDQYLSLRSAKLSRGRGGDDGQA